MTTVNIPSVVTSQGANYPLVKTNSNSSKRQLNMQHQETGLDMVVPVNTVNAEESMNFRNRSSSSSSSSSNNNKNNNNNNNNNNKNNSVNQQEAPKALKTNSKKRPPALNIANTATTITTTTSSQDDSGLAFPISPSNLAGFPLSPSLLSPGAFMFSPTNNNAVGRSPTTKTFGFDFVDASNTSPSPTNTTTTSSSSAAQTPRGGRKNGDQNQNDKTPSSSTPGLSLPSPSPRSSSRRISIGSIGEDLRWGQTLGAMLDSHNNPLLFTPQTSHVLFSNASVNPHPHVNPNTMTPAAAVSRKRNGKRSLSISSTFSNPEDPFGFPQVKRERGNSGASLPIYNNSQSNLTANELITAAFSPISNRSNTTQENNPPPPALFNQQFVNAHKGPFVQHAQEELFNTQLQQPQRFGLSTTINNNNNNNSMKRSYQQYHHNQQQQPPQKKRAVHKTQRSNVHKRRTNVVRAAVNDVQSVANTAVAVARANGITDGPIIKGLEAGATKLAGKRWTAKQDAQLRAAVKKYNESNWKAIAESVEGRNHVQCLQRWKKVLQPGLIKGMWSQEEDDLLQRLMSEPGTDKSWTKIAERVPGRTAKQCRERWHLNLDPSINRGPWTQQEDGILLGLHAKIGNKWAEIKRSLPGRTENGVKSRYKSIQRALKKDPRFASMNIR